jgi:hypothetical protein
LFEDIVTKYDQWFKENYLLLKGKVNYVFQGDLEEDDQCHVLHDVYYKMKNRIILSGFTGLASGYSGSFMSYAFRSIRYSMMERYNKNKRVKHFFYDIGNPELQKEINDFYDDAEYFNNGYHVENYHLQLEILTRLLFQFIEERYSEKESSLFKQYYLSGSNTYPKLCKTTGYKFGSIKTIISTMKKDVKTNFIRYVRSRSRDLKD